MKLIIGLGNYGSEYERTRHNYGFMVLDEFARKNSFPEFRLAKEHIALVSIDNDVILVKPQTYMNKSGKAVESLASYYKIEPKDIVVIHDDADVRLGEIKIAEEKGAAGHNGVQSIIDELKTNKFRRLRMGIDSEDPSYKEPLDRGEGLEGVVLKNFSKEEEIILKNTIDKAVEILKL